MKRSLDPLVTKALSTLQGLDMDLGLLGLVGVLFASPRSLLLLQRSEHPLCSNGTLQKYCVPCTPSLVRGRGACPQLVLCSFPLKFSLSPVLPFPLH